MSADPVLTAALEYASLGWPVFPRGVQGVGVYQATTDAEALTAMWRPGTGLALACGAVAAVFVLDVDCKGADGFASLAALEAEHGALPPAWTVVTPSGGRHLYFEHPDRPLTNRVGFRPGLDVRTQGGSATLPPTIRNGVAYRWEREPWAHDIAQAPGWLIDAIAPPLPPLRPREPLRVQSTDRTARWVAAAVNNECAQVATAISPGRNLKLFQAACNLGEIVGSGLLSSGVVEDVLAHAADACGLLREDGQRAIAATITSGLRRGLQNPRGVAA